MGNKSTREERRAKTWALGVFEVNGLAWSPPKNAGIQWCQEDSDADGGGEDDGSDKLPAEAVVPFHHYDPWKSEFFRKKEVRKTEPSGETTEQNWSSQETASILTPEDLI
jgi:hypothetical protein